MTSPAQATHEPNLLRTSWAAVKRHAGVAALVLALYVAMQISDPNAASVSNHENLGRRLGYWGLLTLGAGLVIITGGIDLSVGAVVGLSAVALGLLLRDRIWPPLAVILVLLLAAGIGLLQGLLITRLRLQPFIVTLCGLFIYRGLAQFATLVKFDVLYRCVTTFSAPSESILSDASQTVGIGGREDLAGLLFLANGRAFEIPGTAFGVPMPLVLLAIVAVLIYVLLDRSVYGRYLYAIGHNEQAARYAGIAVDRYKVLSYVVCSTLAGIGGVLLLLDVRSVSPSQAGTWSELYAVTGAVLGGCSLRGGEGTVAGMVLGAAVLPLLSSLCIFAGVPSDLELTVIGIALLLGTIADELLKRRRRSG